MARPLQERIGPFSRGLLESYSQIFFSDNILFGLVLLLVTMMDLVAGLSGLAAVVISQILAVTMGYDRSRLGKGIYGFNSLLVGLGVGIQLEPGLLMVAVVATGAVLTFFITVSLQGVIGKYALPYLSIPFLLAIWILLVAMKEMTGLGLSERGIYTFNDIYHLGGKQLIALYEWGQQIRFPGSFRIYLTSLGAIFFQFNILSGLIIMIGLFLVSRISFFLSLLGFYSAYAFYALAGADISDLSYTYIGFNFILTSIAIGGFFIIPTWRSYLWVIILMPLVAIVTITFSRLFEVFLLPIYSLPFNITVLLFLYSLKMRSFPREKLSEVLVQYNSPEKNLYAHNSNLERFGKFAGIPLTLPFFGTWSVSQGHSGEYTHKEEWKNAWDFIVTDREGLQYKGNGDFREDYFCYGKNVLSPGDGWIELIVDNIPDNDIGEINIRQNWGNTVIIRHTPYLFSALSHLQPDSICVKTGTRVKAGDPIGRCGNSGRSPYPHLHFQFQASPAIGAPTLNFPFTYYLQEEENSQKLCSSAIPLKDQRLQNISTNELIRGAMDLVAYKSLKFKTDCPGIIPECELEVRIDPYNNSYLEDLSTGARAWFRYDEKMLLFIRYSGSRKSLLFHLYMALYKQPTGYNPTLIINDELTPDILYREPLRSIQDLAAPMGIFLRTFYTSSQVYIDNELSPSKIHITSRVEKKVPVLSGAGYEYEIHLNNNGLEKIKITQLKGSKKTACTGESYRQS